MRANRLDHLLCSCGQKLVTAYSPLDPDVAAAIRSSLNDDEKLVTAGLVMDNKLHYAVHCPTCGASALTPRGQGNPPPRPGALPSGEPEPWAPPLPPPPPPSGKGADEG